MGEKEIKRFPQIPHMECGINRRKEHAKCHQTDILKRSYLLKSWVVNENEAGGGKSRIYSW